MAYSIVEIAEWETECYFCGIVFRNYTTRFSRTPPRKQQLINIRQNPPIKYFCSKDCKFEYIFSLMRVRERIGEVKGYRSLRL